MHALIYQNFIQIFVEIPDMKAPRKAPYNHKNKTKKYLKMYHPYPFEFLLKKHFCLIPHLGTSIFPKEGHASLFAFMKDQPSKSLQIVKGILVVVFQCEGTMSLQQSFTCEGHMGPAALRPNCVAIVLKPLETPRRQIPSIYLFRALTNMLLAPHCNSCPVLTHHWLSTITAAPGKSIMSSNRLEATSYGI